VALGCAALLLGGCSLQVGDAGLQRGELAYRTGRMDAAMQAYAQAADQGNAEAAYRLGHMLATGIGGRRDQHRAVRYMVQAARSGHSGARFMLGYWHLVGWGVEQDERLAAQNFRQAADQGEAFAQYNLALMHATGSGVAKDLEAARQWLQRARASGYPVPASLAQPGGLEELARYRPPAGPPAVVRRIQAGLKSLGYDPGPVDGIAGPLTRAAVRAFQADRGMPIDGALTERVLWIVERSLHSL
jgi:hypothetical protein